MSAAQYDFRKPSRFPIDLEQRLVDWLSTGLALVAEKWGQHLAAPITHAVGRIDTVRPPDALAELSESTCAYRTTLGPPEFGALVAFPRPLLLTLASGVLGEPCTELSADRNLTAVEASLVELLLQQLFGAIQAGWQSNQPLAVAFAEPEPLPKRTRLFTPDDNLVRTRLLMTGPFGEQAWQWLIPQKQLSSLLGRPEAVAGADQKSGSRALLESLVGDMPVDVAVHLGGAELHVSQLAGLRSGDLVLLDQPVSRPLKASVAGETRFLVWPGRVGPKQAIQIQSLVES